MKSYIGLAAVSLAVCMFVPTVAFASTTAQVKSGDTLWGIAETYHVSVNSLEQVNGLHSSTIRVGEKLQIPGTSTSEHRKSSTALYSTSSRSSRRIVVVTVKSGDTISGIASRYNASVAETLKLNGLTSRSILHIGQKLKVFAGYVGTHSSRGVSSAAGIGQEVLGLNIVSFAKEFIGTPYRWGGESTSGFDCSGYVQFVYGHFGIHIGRTSYAQYDEGGPAPARYPDIGDLVFFNTDGGGASHVGIYVGNGEFINAEDRGVRIDSLSSAYWGAHYIGARHI
ncbi:C40 family peptidase [Alicyclobacillus ferrooxydans]|uniref:Peptidoglycan endopeptidase n=1 Tax=Alicyclobacillus ferrooxydans TaxID=471514 RepID=A0A0P9EKM2_9BACL|nr:NlpC/P60 family protein [Alicyclobacillus ferrooxydans]KPV43689.1 hypothetical protein AN477_11000 [Alicyclobacillus ferrooxydans]